MKTKIFYFIGCAIIALGCEKEIYSPQLSTNSNINDVKFTLETHTELNKKTSWFVNNSLFSGGFFIDTSSVKNISKNSISYFSNRTCLYYGDINGDGKKDIINNYWVAPFGTNKPGAYVTWEYDKTGFKTPHFSEGLTGARKFIFNDYFNNGKLQAIIASSGADSAPFLGDSIQIISFNSDMSMDIKTISDVIGYYHTGASGDIDNDGDIDFILYSGGGASKMGIVYFENIGGNNFKYNPNLVTGLGYINNNPNNYYTIEVFDVNKDGFLDIILGGSKGTSCNNRILWGNNTHTFNTNNQTILSTNLNYNSVVDIAFSDIDNDGDTDVFLLSEIDNKGFGIQIFENKNNTFIDVTSSRMDISNKPNSLWFAWLRLFDIDNDGDYDLVGDGYGYTQNQIVPKIMWINDSKGNYKSSFIF